MSLTAVSTHVALDQINELPVLRIKNSVASATIAIQGAHIFEYCAADSEPLLFVSAAEPFKTGSAIRGGIPVCWPWFGPQPQQAMPLLPTALFAQPSGSGTLSAIHLNSPRSASPTRAVAVTRSTPTLPVLNCWHALVKTLEVSLTTTNLGEQPLPLSRGSAHLLQLQSYQ